MGRGGECVLDDRSRTLLSMSSYNVVKNERKLTNEPAGEWLCLDDRSRTSITRMIERKEAKKGNKASEASVRK
jgi:hypothetical protein